MNPDLTNPRADEIEAILKGMPFAQTLGMRCEILGDEMTAILPFREKLIGNVTIRALHGGAIASFLELTAMLQVFLVSDMPRPPRPINITIDYLRQGHAKDLYARAFVMKMGRRMASVRAEAWQENRADPVSAITAHFMIPQPETSA
ncbi:PaaI family thioesterase [Hyphomonas sp.]|uniref:PaaI family thioesterase n=1 Tax=Hyphomonas sp. TaxID=87 RepID=UPI00391AA772